MDDIIEGLLEHVNGVNEIIKYLNEYEIEDIILQEDLNERLESVKDEIQYHLNSVRDTDYLELLDSKQSAYLGHFGSPTQQEWAKEFASEYKKLKKIIKKAGK